MTPSPRLPEADQEQRSMNARLTIDQITSDQLDQLYDQRDDCGREIERMKLLVAASESPGHAVRMAAQYADKAIENGKRAERAEAAIARLRKACASVQAADQGHNPAVNWVAMRVLEAIDARLVNGAEPASASPCAGFPDQCPNPQPVPALSPYHGGGIRCGCTTPKES